MTARFRPHVLRLAVLAVGLTVVAGAVASSPVRPVLTADKQAVLDRQAAIPAGAAPPAPKNPAYVPPLDPPSPGIPLGRVDDRTVEAPLSPAIFVPTTQWIEVSGDVQLVVYAGSAPGAADAAAVYVWRSDLAAGRDLPGTGLFVAPGLAGPARLIGVTGEIASFDYPGGSATFDLVTHVFSGH